MRTVLLLASIAISLGAAEEADPLATTWRGWISGGLITEHYRIAIRKQGHALVGTALSWRGMPEDLALAAGSGTKTTGYVLPSVMSESFKVGRKDDTVLMQSGDIHAVIGGGFQPDTWSLASPEPGVLVGTPLDKDGKPVADRQVMLCTQARWDAPTLPPPPVGATTSIACVTGTWHYEVYVPKAYDPAKPMPLVVHSDPGGDGKPLSTALADEFGWIMVGLTESKNGPYTPIIQNRDAALLDLRQRLAIDWHRVVFAGESGGARASSVAACSHPAFCAGLLCSIASYEQGCLPPPRIPIFFITGDHDENLNEVTSAWEAAKAAKRPTEFLRHHGGHENGGQENIDAALRWLHGHLAPTPGAPAKR